MFSSSTCMKYLQLYTRLTFSITIIEWRKIWGNHHRQKKQFMFSQQYKKENNSAFIAVLPLKSHSEAFNTKPTQFNLTASLRQYRQGKFCTTIADALIVSWRLIICMVLFLIPSSIVMSLMERKHYRNVWILKSANHFFYIDRGVFFKWK